MADEERCDGPQPPRQAGGRCAILVGMRSASIDQIVANAVSGYGLFRLPVAETVDAIVATPGEHGWDRRVLGTGEPLSVALDFLDVVTWPATRFAAFALDASWTVVVNNLRGGSDVADLIQEMDLTRPDTTVRVVDHCASFVVQNGYRIRTQYEARIVDVHSRGATTRSIACADDGGRWTFDVAGVPLPVEKDFDYSARRKRDRFTRENLAALLQSIGARPVTPTDLKHAHRFTLMTAWPGNRRWRDRITAFACSTEEAADAAHEYFLRGMGWADHVATHATSVVSDLGRAILLNPAFEPRCRAALDEARSNLGSDVFDAVLRQADRGLRRV